MLYKYKAHFERHFNSKQQIPFKLFPFHMNSIKSAFCTIYFANIKYQNLFFFFVIYSNEVRYFVSEYLSAKVIQKGKKNISICIQDTRIQSGLLFFIATTLFMYSKASSRVSSVKIGCSGHLILLRTVILWNFLVWIVRILAEAELISGE